MASAFGFHLKMSTLKCKHIQSFSTFDVTSNRQLHDHQPTPYFIYITLFLQFLFTETHAQFNEIFHDSTPKVGFVFGYGGQEFDHFFRNDNTKRKNHISSTITRLGINLDKINLDVNYVYISKFYQFQYYITFIEKENWGIELLIQPQLNTAEFKDFASSTKKKSFEYGLNIGNKFYYNLLDERLEVFLI